MNVPETRAISLIDSHAHLELDPLIHDTKNVVDRARNIGLIAIITVGIDLKDSERALELAHKFEDVFACVGFHPHNAKHAGIGELEEIEKMATDSKVVGYGEIGLDFFRNHSPRDIQITIFEEQIRIAKNLEKPVVIHLRDAYSEGLSMLEEAGPFQNSGVIHCFSGNQEDAERALEMGFYISIPGTVTYRKNDQLRSIVAKLPEDRILLETDCPFLAPEPLRGKDNEPAFIIHTARKVAETRGSTPEEIGKVTARNACKLFGLPQHILERL